MATPQHEPVKLQKQKLGHLRVDEQGEVTYKKTPSSTLMASLQLGLQHSIGGLEPKPRRDILMTDFNVIETVDFPSGGSAITQAHKYKDFTFTTYSPVAFRFFREAFQIKAEDYLLALCHQPLRELSNPGASGSLFYLSADDEFIIKTVQKKEAVFLQKLLPGYYLNLTQNKRTLLPKFFGLYQYKCGGVKIRIVVMNNLLPSSLHYHWKFDLKGSTYKRRASPAELEKKSPTFKDLDFSIQLADGLWLPPDKYDILNSTLLRDCQVLESFGIMDFSLLLGVYNVDEATRAGEPPPTPTIEAVGDTATAVDGDLTGGGAGGGGGDGDERERSRTFLQSRIEARKNFSIFNPETLTSDTDLQDFPTPGYPEGYIQARTKGGDRLLLYLGVIDILQSYRLKKRLEHGFKSIITDGDTVSVHNPSFYSQRFLTFLNDIVFKKDRVKIKPRRNSTIAPSKGPRRQASAHQGGTSRHQLQRQSSKQKSSSPPHPNSPPRSPPLPSHDDITATKSDTSLKRSSGSSSKDHAPHHTPQLEPHDTSIELNEVQVIIDDPSSSSSSRKGSTGIRINTSTPINELDDSPLPIISSSASIIVEATYSKDGGGSDKEQEGVRGGEESGSGRQDASSD